MHVIHSLWQANVFFISLLIWQPELQISSQIQIWCARIMLCSGTEKIDRFSVITGTRRISKSFNWTSCGRKMSHANVDNSSAIGNITVRDNRTGHIKCFIHPLYIQTSIWETAYRQLLEALQKTLEGDWGSIKFKPAVASCFCYNSSPPIATATSFFPAIWPSSEHKSNGRFSRWTCNWKSLQLSCLAKWRVSPE